MFLGPGTLHTHTQSLLHQSDQATTVCCSRTLWEHTSTALSNETYIDTYTVVLPYRSIKFHVVCVL
ncbi:hypothetical protein E2C01_010107 [Portunus trituberculatus]|uniref:Uncharacterized protein n=1 Tax=Portunus trituberculatus TaxID=210409 RepID=A0A5B7D7T9_PORTR|nr:hypothetical protein [Portunus trituberculatus]